MRESILIEVAETVAESASHEDIDHGAVFPRKRHIPELSARVAAVAAAANSSPTVGPRFRRSPSIGCASPSLGCSTPRIDRTVDESILGESDVTRAGRSPRP